MKNGSTAQDRRRARRAAERAGISEDDLAAIQELALVASAPDADVEILPTSGDPLPEELALAKIDEAFQHGTACACGYSLDKHNGATGACSHADGRGTCSCASFSEATTDESAQAEALEGKSMTATIHVDALELVGPQLEKALRATLGDDENADEFVQRFMLEFVEIAPPADGGVETAHGPIAWKAIFVPEATLTDDGRAFAPGALEWRELPLSLMAMTKTSALGGHDGAEVSGRIDQIWREGNLIMAGGVFDDGDFGNEISRMVADGTLRGLSVDIAIHEAERGPKSDYFDENGNWITEKPETAEEEPSIEDMLFGDDGDLILVVTKGVIGMATVCPFPAFAEANISLVASAANPLVWTYERPLAIVELRPLEPTTIVAAAEELAPMPDCANCDHAFADHPDGGACDVDGCDCSEYDGPDAEPDDDPDDRASLTAAAAGLAPLNPPVEWFQNPELEELTPLTIDEDGRIYGHAWGWGTCHTGVQGTCTTAPHSNTNYAYFHVGEIECEDGELVAVGRITFDTGHADRRLSRQPALAHYDHTGKIGAFVVVGEDAFGGWIAGTLAAEISEEDVQRFRGSAPSGDWRSVNGNLELIALLSVNVPGFPVPRPRALVAAADDGLHVLSLTAAGIAEVLRERTPEDDFREIEALVDFARGGYDELLREARG